MVTSTNTPGRPKLELDGDLIKRLRDKPLGWRQVADEYEKQTGVYISRETVKRRYEGLDLKDDRGGFAPILHVLKEGVSEIPTSFASRIKGYDSSLIVRYRDMYGLSWRGVARLYAHRTGRRICHKTAKRKYQKAKGS